MEILEVYTESDDGSSNELEIYINNKKVFSVDDSYSPDNTLCDNFNDCYEITNLMKMAYEAGKKGEEFNLTKEEY